jgi:hypothetical protein
MSRALELDGSFFSKAIKLGAGDEPQLRQQIKQREATHTEHRQRPPQREQPRSEKKRDCPRSRNTDAGQKSLISASNLKFLNYLGFRVNRSWVEKNK